MAAKLDETHGLKKFLVDRYVDLGERVVAEHGVGGQRPAWEKLPYEALDAVDRREDPPRDRPRPGPHPDLRGRPDPPRSHPLVPRHRAAGHRALRPDRDVRPDHVQPARATTGSARVGRPIPGRARCASPTTARSSCRAATSAMGYFHDPTAHRRVDRRGRLDALGRRRPPRRRRLPHRHRPQEGSDHHRRRPEHRAAGDRARSPSTRADLGGHRDRRRPPLSHRRCSPSMPTRSPTGPRRTTRSPTSRRSRSDPDLRAEIDAFIEQRQQPSGRGSSTSASTASSPTSFTIAAGEMTPTLKVKRNVVNAELPRR